MKLLKWGSTFDWGLIEDRLVLQLSLDDSLDETWNSNSVSNIDWFSGYDSSKKIWNLQSRVIFPE
jgi:hypothetical protein